MHQTSYRCVLNYKLQITVWPRESLWFCNDLVLSDPTIAPATACRIHMYKRLVIESDGDSYVEKGEKKRTGVGDVGWGDRGREYEAPPNSPKNNLQLWMNTLSQSNFNSVDVYVCVCVCVCWRQWNAE